MPTSGHNFMKLDEKEIIRLYTNELLNVSQIAKIFGVNHGTINLRLKKHGIKKRTHKETQKLAMNRPEVKETVSKASIKSQSKRKATNLQKYGTEVPFNNVDIKEKYKQEHLDKHGVLWPNQRQDVRDKFVNTCKERYETDNVSKTNEVRKKISQNRWENKTEEELQEIKNKTIQTWMGNYNVDNPLKVPEIAEQVRLNRWENKSEEELQEIKNKTIQTWLQKYNKTNPTKDENIKRSISNTMKYFFINKQLPELLNYLHLDIKEEWKHAHHEYTFICRECKYEFKQVWNEVQQGYTCPKCYPRNTHSKPQMEITEFIESYLNSELLIRGDRKILQGKELDIYIPDLNIAIEFNGLYYHSEELIKDKNYHLNKTEECEKKGIRLIHIFEDEWIYKKDIVKARLLNILGINNRTRIHARKCTIKEIKSNIKNDFLEKFHIQGKDSSIIKLGSFYNNKLVSVMTFSKGNISKGSKPKEGIWELNRFCSNYNYHIPGIASKLLTYFKRNYEWTEIFSYADRRWSDGNVYKKIGFELEHTTKSNYWYIKGLQRIHRFTLRKRFNEPKEISEWVLRQTEGYFRIWDCGNYKFTLRS